MPFQSLPLASIDLKVLGELPLAYSAGVNLQADGRVRANIRTLVALDACSGSHTGISVAMLRFSYWVVAVGKVPSIGIARNRQVIAVHRNDLRRHLLDKFRGAGGHHARAWSACWSPCRDSQPGSMRSTRDFRAAMFISTTLPPLRPYVSSTAAWIISIAFSSGSTPEILKNAACMMMLIRPPRPTDLANGVAVDHVELGLLVDDLLLDFVRHMIPHLIRAVGAVEQENTTLAQASGACRIVQGTRSYGTPRNRPARSGRGCGSGFEPKRRCDIVHAPDFLES